MAIPTREDFQRLEDQMKQVTGFLARLVELAETGSTIGSHAPEQISDVAATVANPRRTGAAR